MDYQLEERIEYLFGKLNDLSLPGIEHIKILKEIEHLDLESTITPLLQYNSDCNSANIKKVCQNVIVSIIRKVWLNKFDDIPEDKRELYGQILGKWGYNIIDSIRNILKNKDAEVRLKGMMMIMYLSSHISDTVTISKLTHTLNKILINDVEAKVRATAVKVFAKLSKNAMIKTVSKCLTDEDDRVRANTIEALEEIKSDAVIPLVKHYLNDKNNRVRANAVKFLWSRKDKSYKESLKKMLESKNPEVNISGLWILSTTKDSQFDPYIIQMANSENNKVREWSVRLLEANKPSGFKEMLLILSNDKNLEVAYDAKKALERLEKYEKE